MRPKAIVVGKYFFGIYQEKKTGWWIMVINDEMFMILMHAPVMEGDKI